MQMDGVTCGNAATLATTEGTGYWFIGHMAPESCPRHNTAFEVKWGMHPMGESHGFDSPKGVRSISILIHGKMRLQFREASDTTQTQDVVLEKEGDFVLWEPDIMHNSYFLED